MREKYLERAHFYGLRAYAEFLKDAVEGNKNMEILCGNAVKS